LRFKCWWYFFNRSYNYYIDHFH